MDTLSFQLDQIAGKWLNAALGAPEDGADAPEVPGFIPGVLPGEGYFRFPIPAEWSYSDARLNLERFWRTAGKMRKNWVITGTAMRFELKLRQPMVRISKGFQQVFSGNFENAAASLDAGVTEEAE
ncbi:MAG: hypothetical protein E7055_20535 [Lentisphaerae bacterium]|nr:hypothetical protein [Lentisphaerota bacterium]